MSTFFAKAGELFKAIFRRPPLIVAVAVAIIAVMVVTRPRLQPVDLPERVWPVNVVEVKRGDQQPSLELFGEVVAGRRSELRALVPGIIVDVGENFREGAVVETGELMVQIDPFEFRNDVAEWTAMVKESQVNVQVKERDLGRVQELFSENNVSEQALDDAKLAVEQQQAMLEQRRIGLARAQRALKDARLVAPYAGVLSGVSVDLGKRLNVNDKVADLIDTNRLEVRFTLSNSQFGRIIESSEGITGRRVEAQWQVGEEAISYDATIRRVGAEIDSTTGGVVVYATIEPDAKTMLRPGAFVWIRMPDKLYEQVFRAPDSALYEGDIVYTVRSGRLVAEQIKVVGRMGTDILFRNTDKSNVADGDALLITQIREGGEGVKVEIR
jgi:RND family efflux transporter MFP subunit